MEKIYDELTFTDDFIFCKVPENNEELCRELLELILGKKVRKISYPAKQKIIDITSDGKGVRLDVYLEDEENKVYDIEMQTTGNRNLPKRSRYYQGIIDLNLIEKGEDYLRLKESYVIFICLKNPFGRELHKYSFENRCKEDTSLFLEDGTHKVFITPDGKAEDISERMQAFLNYLTGTVEDDVFVQKLDRAVENVKHHEEWRQEYMTLLMRDREKREEGFQEGIAIGREKGREEGLRRAVDSIAEKMNLTVEAACQAVGITPEQYYGYKNT